MNLHRFLSLPALLLTLGAVSPVMAQLPAPPKPDAPLNEASPIVVAAARDLLNSVLAAYRAAPVLVDQADEEVAVLGKLLHKQYSDIVMGPEGILHLTDAASEVAAYDGYVRVKIKSQTRRYALIPIVTTVSDALRGYLGILNLHLALRSGKPLEEIMRALALDIPGQNVKISDLQKVKDENGTELDEVTFFSGEGFAKLRVNPSTKLIVSVVSDFHEPGSPPGFRYRREARLHPRIIDALEAPISFDPEGRQAVESIDRIVELKEDESVKGVSVGGKAPAFTLRTMEGKATRVAPSSNGRVMILAFWSTGLQTSKRDIQTMKQLVKWAADQGAGIDVHLINAREERLDKSERWSEVSDFLDENPVEHPVLFDEDNKVAEIFAIYATPALVVIGPDGIVRGVHLGMGDDKVALVRNLVTSLKKAP